MKLIAALLLLLITGVFAYPPGSPMSEFGPNQTALGVYFEQSGQELYDTATSSFLNTAGVNLDYAPWKYFQLGIFGGGGELDVNITPGKENVTNIQRYESDLTWQFGLSSKLATPRVFNNTTGLVVYGSGEYISTEMNKYFKKTFVYSAGGSIQIAVLPRLNLVFGGEFYALDGTQGPTINGDSKTFSNQDNIRGLIGFEFYMAGKNRSYISVAFRPTPNLDWESGHGIKGASISISLGAISITSTRGNAENGDDEGGNLE